MMKMRVVIKFEIETDEYHGVAPNCNSTLNLVESMLNREADLPFGKITVNVHRPDGLGAGTAL